MKLFKIHIPETVRLDIIFLLFWRNISCRIEPASCFFEPHFTVVMWKLVYQLIVILFD